MKRTTFQRLSALAAALAVALAWASLVAALAVVLEWVSL